MLDKILHNLPLFIEQHYILVVLFLVLVGVFIFTELKRGGLQVSPQEVSHLINRDNALVIDLRKAEAFRKGHIHGSENVPNDQFDDELARLEKLDRPIVLACEIGTQSAAAGRKLLAKGLKNVYRLKGGVDAWQGSHLPLVKK